jgi:hypothetical protein
MVVYYKNSNIFSNLATISLVGTIIIPTWAPWSISVTIWRASIASLLTSMPRFRTTFSFAWTRAARISYINFLLFSVRWRVVWFTNRPWSWLIFIHFSFVLVLVSQFTLSSSHFYCKFAHFLVSLLLQLIFTFNLFTLRLFICPICFY